MKKFLFLFLLPLQLFSQSISPQWIRTVSDTILPGDFLPGDVKADNNGNVYTLSYLRHSLGQHTLLIQKYDAGGTLQWRDSIPSVRQYGKLSIIPSGSIIIAYSGAPIAFGELDIAVTSYSPNGMRQWTSFFDSSPVYNNDMFTAMVTDTSGSVYVSSQSYNSSNTTGFIVKCDSAGNLLWSDSVAVANQNIIPEDIAVDRQGYLYVALEITDLTSQASDGEVIKYLPTGQRQYQIPFNTGYDEHFRFIRVYNDTSIYVGGFVGSIMSNHPVVIKYDSTGALKFFSGFHPQVYYNYQVMDAMNNIYYMAVDPNGNICLGGEFLTNTSIARAGIVQFTNQGGLGWVNSPFLNGYVTEMEFNSTGNLFVTGIYDDSTILHTMFLSKLDTVGNTIWNDNHYGLFADPALSINPYEEIFLFNIDYTVNANEIYTIKYGSTTAISEEENEIVATVYPNPFSIDINFVVPLNDFINSVELINVQGQRVLYSTGINANSYHLNRGDLCNGVYFYSLILESGKVCRGKIVAF